MRSFAARLTSSLAFVVHGPTFAALKSRVIAEGLKISWIFLQTPDAAPAIWRARTSPLPQLFQSFQLLTACLRLIHNGLGGSRKRLHSSLFSGTNAGAVSV